MKRFVRFISSVIKAFESSLKLLPVDRAGRSFTVRRPSEFLGFKAFVQEAEAVAVAVQGFDLVVLRSLVWFRLASDTDAGSDDMSRRWP